jgi:tellurite resistance protein TehA-like permease
MATAGASVLAGPCGWPSLAVPLLGLAIVQAAWLPIAGLLRHGTELRLGGAGWWTIGPAQEHSGIHTVPLGLAIIASGLFTLSAREPGSWPLLPAEMCLGLTWLTTLSCIGRFGGSLAARGFSLKSLDGTWFLVPAVLLGTGIATEAMIPHCAPRWAGVLAAAALSGVLLGWAVYCMLAVTALARLYRHGLDGAPLAPWWIAMGCAGLAAAALGRVLEGEALGSPLRTFLSAAAVSSADVAVVLCVPVLVGGTWFLLRRCRYRAAAAWPPTFSTAAFALGCLQAGAVAPSQALRTLGIAAGDATLLFWAVTSGWNVKCAYAVRFGRGGEPTVATSQEPLRRKARPNRPQPE